MHFCFCFAALGVTNDGDNFRNQSSMIYNFLLDAPVLALSVAIDIVPRPPCDVTVA
jgi:hypothetical protein